MVRCFNEECLKRDTELYRTLYIQIYNLVNCHQRASYYVKGKAPILSTLELKEGAAPGSLTQLKDLPPYHPAILYLRSRGYDIDELVHRWQLMYCERASPQFKLAENRIIIPIVQNKIWVGWQARYIGDIDFKATKICKYYTLPSMPKRLVLYNHDKALAQSMVIICEGPTSAWSLYPYGVALLGKNATIQQQRIIAKQCANKHVLIMLDGDAVADTTRLYNQLKSYIKNLVRISLPPDRDPGSYYHDPLTLWSLMYKQAEDQNIQLPV
jgi:hypothetical protein